MLGDVGQFFCALACDSYPGPHINLMKTLRVCRIRQLFAIGLVALVQLCIVVPGHSQAKPATAYIADRHEQPLLSVESLCDEGDVQLHLAAICAAFDWVAAHCGAVPGEQVRCGCVKAWPEYSQQNSYQSIFSFQYYISALEALV